MCISEMKHKDFLVQTGDLTNGLHKRLSQCPVIVGGGGLAGGHKRHCKGGQISNRHTPATHFFRSLPHHGERVQCQFETSPTTVHHSPHPPRRRKRPIHPCCSGIHEQGQEDDIPSFGARGVCHAVGRCADGYRCPRHSQQCRKHHCHPSDAPCREFQSPHVGHYSGDGCCRDLPRKPCRPTNLPRSPPHSFPAETHDEFLSRSAACAVRQVVQQVAQPGGGRITESVLAASSSPSSGGSSDSVAPCKQRTCTGAI